MSELHPSSPQPLPGAKPAAPAGPAKIAGVPIQTIKTNDPNLEPLSLVDDAPPSPAATSAAPPVSKIKAFGPGATAATHTYKRQPVVTGRGAIRVRSFHGRLSDEGMVFMDEKINEWLDQHPDIEVKFATTTIGTYEGKIREPALVVNIWY